MTELAYLLQHPLGGCACERNLAERTCHWREANDDGPKDFTPRFALTAMLRLAKDPRMPQISVFLAHSSQQNDLVDTLAQNLATADLAVFNDKYNISPGDPFPKVIREHLASADLFVLLASQSSLAPDSYVRTELETYLTLHPRAVEEGRVLPLVVEDLGDLSLPPRLRGISLPPLEGEGPLEPSIQRYIIDKAQRMEGVQNATSPIPLASVLVLGSVSRTEREQQVVHTIGRLLGTEYPCRLMLAGQDTPDRISCASILARMLPQELHTSCWVVDGHHQPSEFGSRNRDWKSAIDGADFVVFVGHYEDETILVDGQETGWEGLHQAMRRAPRSAPWLPVKVPSQGASTTMAEELMKTVYGPTPMALSADIMVELVRDSPPSERTLRQAIRALHAFRDRLWKREAIRDLDLDDLVHDLDTTSHQLLGQLHQRADGVITSNVERYPTQDTVGRLRNRIKQERRRLAVASAVGLVLTIGATLFVESLVDQGPMAELADLQANLRLEEQKLGNRRQVQFEGWAERLGRFMGEVSERVDEQLSLAVTQGGPPPEQPPKRDFFLKSWLRTDLYARDPGTMRAELYRYASKTDKKWSEATYWHGLLHERAATKEFATDVLDESEKLLVGHLESAGRVFNEVLTDQSFTNLLSVGDQPLTPPVERFETMQEGSAAGPLMWAYVGFARTGLTVVHPASPTHPASFDPRERPWYLEGDAAKRKNTQYGRVVWSAPYRDVFGERLREYPVVSVVKRVAIEGMDDTIGVIGIDVDALYIQVALRQILHDFDDLDVVAVVDPRNCVRFLASKDIRYRAPTIGPAGDVPDYGFEAAGKAGKTHFAVEDESCISEITQRPPSRLLPDDAPDEGMIEYETGPFRQFKLDGKIKPSLKADLPKPEGWRLFGFEKNGERPEGERDDASEALVPR